jgi:transcription antitermination factor NusG
VAHALSISLDRPDHCPFGALSAPGDWFVMHTKSRQEKSLADTLVSMRVPHFLPLVPRVRFYGRRKAKVETPLFPGYVFLKGTREQAFDADRTNRVARIIDVRDQRQLNEELHALWLALNHDQPLDPYPYLREGIRVVVRSGPLRGMQGLIESRTSRDRLVLQVHALGQASSLEIDPSLLEPIE